MQMTNPQIAPHLFRQNLSICPLVAILRGITPDEVESVASVILEEGFRFLEIPLNSPDALKSIELVVARFGGEAIIGAGTVMTSQDVHRVRDIGGKLIVTPHVDSDVISSAHDLDLICVPGVATPSEGFSALRAGATGLKVFPAEAISPAVLKAWRAVFAADIALIPTGGISPTSMLDWIGAGASGFGIGGQLYKPGLSVEDVRESAKAFAAGWKTHQHINETT